MLSYKSKMTDKRGQYDWKAEKNLDGYVCLKVALHDLPIERATNRAKVRCLQETYSPNPVG